MTIANLDYLAFFDFSKNNLNQCVFSFRGKQNLEKFRLYTMSCHGPQRDRKPFFDFIIRVFQIQNFIIHSVYVSFQVLHFLCFVVTFGPVIMMNHIFSTSHKFFILLLNFSALHQFFGQKPLWPLIYNNCECIQSQKYQCQNEKDVFNRLYHFSKHSMQNLFYQFSLCICFMQFKLRNQQAPIIRKSFRFDFGFINRPQFLQDFIIIKKMAKKTAVAKVVKSSKVLKAKLKNGVKKPKDQKPSTKKVTKTKQVKKTPVKVSKRLAEKKQVKSTGKKIVKPAKAVKAVKPAKPSKPARATKSVKKASQNSGPKGYTSSQYAKFKSEKNKLEEQTNQELKDELRKNMQSMSGNKDELIYKVADGRVLGRIPRCPKCFGGRPKFDFKKGTYYCSGYRDDEDFKNCHSTFQLNQLKRQPWE